MRRSKLGIFLAILSFSTVLLLTNGNILPSTCKYDAVRRAVDCSNAGLNSVPTLGVRTRRLILASNNISRFDQNSFKNLRELQYLDLTQNKLESLDEFSLASLNLLRKLKINGNPLNCDCRLEWLRQEMTRSFKKHRFVILEADGVKCASPENFQGKLLSRVNDTLECDKELCKNAGDTCDENAGLCTLLNKEFICECKRGYNGDGYSCIDINECIVNNHSCHRNAMCTNTVGSYTCKCIPGFHGDGQESCQPLNNNMTFHYLKTTQYSQERRAVEIIGIVASFALVTAFVVLVFIYL